MLKERFDLLQLVTLQINEESPVLYQAKLLKINCNKTISYELSGRHTHPRSCFGDLVFEYNASIGTLPEHLGKKLCDLAGIAESLTIHVSSNGFYLIVPGYIPFADKGIWGCIIKAHKTLQSIITA